MTLERSSTLRSLTPEELDLVSGGTGEDDEIVVTGTKVSSIGSSYWAGGGAITESYAGNAFTSDGGGGGGYTPPPLPEESDDPNGDDDGDGILNQHEVIVVTALDAKTMQAIQGASDLLAKSLMALGVLGTGGVGTSVGAYYSQLLSAVVGSAKAGEILAYLTGVAAGSYVETDLKNVIAEGMIDREQQDLADDGVRNMSWHDTWD